MGLRERGKLELVNYDISNTKLYKQFEGATRSNSWDSVPCIPELPRQARLELAHYLRLV